jgi:hypothetical protein
MKKLLLLIILSFQFSFGQVKLWNNKLEKIKTKGTFLTINKEILDGNSNKTDEIFGVFPTYTLAGTLLPFVFKYGNSTLKSLTSKDEKDYASENLSINNFILPFDELENDSIHFNIALNYYPKGEDESLVASKYIFTVNRESNSLTIKLDSADEEDYIPVKSKKKYDFVLETFDITVHAEIISNVNDTIQKVELKTLGTTKITRTVASFRGGIDEIRNNGMVLYPKYDSKNKEIIIKNLIFSCNVKYLNPYGLMQSSINKFLENNSDTNESLLNTIFVESDD